MNSNFAFLREYWPDMAQIGEAAEEYMYSDPNACIYKLGVLAERITTEMLSVEKIALPEDNTQLNRLHVLKREGLIPSNIDNIFFAIRKARNEAVHVGKGDVSKAEVLVRMCHSLCDWFMEVYGDWNHRATPFVMPTDKSLQPEYADIIKAHEEKIEELSKKLETITTVASNKSKEDRAKHAETVSENIVLSETEEEYLVTEQVRLEVDALPVVNYALQQNGIPVIKSITIDNRSDKAISDVEITITSQPEICLEVKKHIDSVPMNTSLGVKDIRIDINGDYLAQLTERINCILSISLVSDGNLITSETVPLTVLAYDEWHGAAIFPEIISAFITPNHPEISKIVLRTSELLGQWTGDPSLDAYQSKDVNRVLKQVAAVYNALQEQRITYVVHPASFETMGQRVRLCDTVITQKLGTCLDLSLLYASCIEAIGLNPILVLQKGHIFAGVWLEETSFSETIQDDPSLVTKRFAEGINEIAVVECTAYVDGHDRSFDVARSMAENSMRNFDNFEYIVDVKRSRLSGVHPIPMRVMTTDGWRVIREEKDKSDISNAPKAVMGAIEIGDGVGLTPATRKLRWERKLLDIGLRNTLINLRMTKSVIPLLSSSLDDLEDLLSDGSEFAVLPKPADWHMSDATGFDMLPAFGTYEELITAEFKSKRLRSFYTERELEEAIKNVYRVAKISMEENGANTLYLAMGLLKWFENPRSTKARYAPIVLLPIEIIRKSAVQGYVIRLRDDEPQMNITLLEKLKQDFGITIEGLDPLPLDEHGVDVRKVLTVLRKASMNQKNWDVVEAACFGIFSFSQFVMWNDVRNRSDDLEKNKLVKSLMEGRLCWDAKPMEIGDKVSEDGALLPIPADASQLFAIKEASEGETFVLHGPPGTGKSQTITAMIANALAQGKTVLFVAEKMAALEVVQKRLQNIGIGPFCLELHSNKSKKKDVLEQLQKAADVARRQPQEKYQQRIEQISKLRQELDSYAKALHKKQSCGMSLFELINEYEANKTEKEIEPFEQTVIQNMNNSLFEEQTILVERLVAAGKAVGHPANHPLSAIKCKGYSQQFKVLIPQTTERYRDSLKNLNAELEKLNAVVDYPLESYADLIKFVQISEEMLVWLHVPESWAKRDNYDQFLESINGLVNEGEKANQRRRELEAHWRDEFFDLDGQALFDEYQNAVSKWFIPRISGISVIRKKLALYSKNKKVAGNLLAEQLLQLVNYQKARIKLKELASPIEANLENYYKGENSDWGQIKNMASRTAVSQKKLQKLTGSENFRKKYCGDGSLNDVLHRFISSMMALKEPKDAFDKLLYIDQTEDKNWLANQMKLLENINDHYDEIKEWISWRNIEAEALSKGLKPVVRAYVSGMAHEEVVKAYRCEVSKELAMNAIDNDKLLSSFSGSVFNEKITQFKRMDAELTELTRNEIFCRLAANIPNFSMGAAQSSEISILLKAIKSNGRGLSIRKLFEQIPNILPRLCPCMLMSPISAAQYLDPKRAPFDLVIFDEASQIPTCKAVGALARGKNAVIVGDPKQMPPTSFFETNTIEEENMEKEDLESILDDCLVLNMPQTHLLWHYRSRHESLIAFSNHQFYDNKLFTFPSVNDRENKVSIVFIEGTFERGKTRTNKAEAEAVVKDLIMRCHDPLLCKQSVGVVTFNVSQQYLIDDLLTEACKDDSALEEWAYNSEEPLFIKNLENVQGDERDVILFSIGYGPDQNGRVSMNFGPLNREGGWRRLNVAVSRAKCEMKVFSSLRPEMINLSRTSAAGVAALKSFLEYASGIPLMEDDTSIKTNTVEYTGIVDSICEKLKKNGYDTDKMVGHSEYKIDIAVVDPQNPEKYLCGILLDGNNYGEAKTTRDREVAQKAVLAGLGWTILRVWAMDWWDNSSKEMNRILTFLKEGNESEGQDLGENSVVSNNSLENGNTAAIQQQAYEGLSTTTQNYVEDQKTIAVAQEYRAYVPVEIKTVDAQDFSSKFWYDLEIGTIIWRVVMTEAPISGDLLIRRVAQSFGFARSGARIQKKIESILISQGLNLSYWQDRMFVWQKEQLPDKYFGVRANGEGAASRDIRDVPVQEIANAICYVLFEQVSLSEDDLAREAAKLLGYTRMGANVVPAVNEAINYAQTKGMIKRDANSAWILTETGWERAKEVAEYVKHVAI